MACTQTPEQRAKDATVLIIAGDADGTIGSGSGFFVESDKIATNIHVVAGRRMIFAVGTKKVYNIEGVTGYAPEHDLVILKVSGKGKPLELAEGKIGDPIFALGYPGGGYNRTEGTVHGIRWSDRQLRLVPEGFPENREMLRLHGNSGGPVLNSEGKVIGVVVLGDEVFGDTFTAIASSELNALLNSSNGENLSDWRNRKPIRAHVYEAWGTKKLISENYEESVKDFDKALKLYKYADTYEKLGSAKHGLGQYQEAIQDFDKAIELIPDNFTAYYNRGFAKLKSGDYAGAIQDCGEVIELNPDDAQVYLVQGPAKEAKLDYVGAIEDYTQAINNLNPKEPWGYYYHRGNAKLNSKNYDGAIQDYTEAIDGYADPIESRAIALKISTYLNRAVAKAEKPDPDYAGAIEDYGKIIVLAPKDSRAYYNRGNAKKALGQNEDAKQDHAVAYYYWGKADSNNGNYQASIDNFDKAIELDPNYAEAYHYRGDAYRLRGQKEDFQKAIADYDKGVALKPDYTEIHVIYNNRGLAKVGLKDYAEAIKDYTKAIELKSNYAEAHYNRGDAYRLQGQKDGFQKAIGNPNFKKADKDYTETIKLKSDFADAYYKRKLAKEALGQNDAAKLDFVMAYFLWGVEANTSKQYQEAIKNFDTILELEPDIAFVYSHRGSAKGALGKSKADLGDLEGALKLYQAAINDYNEAIKLDEEDAYIYRNRGGTRFWRAAIRDHNGMIKDYELAIEDFTKTFKRKSDFMQKSDFTDTYKFRGNARCMLGYIKANQGNLKEARKQYNLALKDFKEAINFDGDNAEYYKGLGLAKASLGKAKGAIDAFEKAKQLEEAKSGK
ncbi:MAG: tetratricopeptide repeat protein [Candidatus Poribacteria bacterium]|nr:tetratricopeptide repeat protein [Candidatus Poribacteria bacterium]